MANFLHVKWLKVGQCVFRSSAKQCSALEEPPLRHASSSLSCWLSSFVPDISSVCVPRFLFCCGYRVWKEDIYVCSTSWWHFKTALRPWPQFHKRSKEVLQDLLMTSTQPTVHTHTYIYISTITNSCPLPKWEVFSLLRFAVNCASNLQIACFESCQPWFLTKYHVLIIITMIKLG